MDEVNLIDILLTQGGTVVMAVLFIFVLIFDRKDRKEMGEKEREQKEVERKESNALLKELSASNRNIAESLNLLKTSIDTNTNEFRQHDERSIKEFGNIKQDLAILKERK